MTPPKPRDQRANVAVIEAILITLVLLGSILFVLSFQTPAGDQSSSRQDLALQAQDALQVLGSLRTTDGTYGGHTLDGLVARAALGDPADLDHEIAGLLPGGARGRLILDGGGAPIPLTGTAPPGGETVTASRAYVPTWPSLFLRTGLRVYPSASPGGSMTVLAVPMREGLPVPAALEPGTVNFTNDYETTIAPGGFPSGVWGNRNVPSALAGAGYPVTGTLEVRSNWTLEGVNVTGSAPYLVSSDPAVAAAQAPARDGLRHASLGVTPGDGTLGGNVTLSFDLRPVRDRLVANATPLVGGFSAHVEVLGPAPDESRDPTGWGTVASWDTASPDGAVTWSVPWDALLGVHPVVAELNYTLNGTSGPIPQSARLVGTVAVNPPGAHGNGVALYDLQLVAWYEDWG